MDHSRYGRLSATELTLDIMESATIYWPGEEKIGLVSHGHRIGAGTTVIVYVDDFLGIAANPVALPVSNLDFMCDKVGGAYAITLGRRVNSRLCPSTLILD